MKLPQDNPCPGDISIQQPGSGNAVSLLHGLCAWAPLPLCKGSSPHPSLGVSLTLLTPSVPAQYTQYTQCTQNTQCAPSTPSVPSQYTQCAQYTQCSLPVHPVCPAPASLEPEVRIPAVLSSCQGTRARALPCPCRSPSQTGCPPAHA